MLEDTAVGFWTNTSCVEIFAGKFFGLVRKIALISPMTIICEIEFAQFFCQINWGDRWGRKVLCRLVLVFLAIIWILFWRKKITERNSVHRRFLYLFWLYICALNFFVFLGFLHFLNLLLKFFWSLLKRGRWSFATRFWCQTLTSTPLFYSITN